MPDANEENFCEDCGRELYGSSEYGLCDECLTDLEGDDEA